MDLRLDVSEQNGWSVVEVGGEIDVATAPRLREQAKMAGIGRQRSGVGGRGRDSPEAARRPSVAALGRSSVPGPARRRWAGRSVAG